MALNILCIFDTDEQCRSVCGLLSGEGHGVTCTRVGHEVVGVVREQRPDLVILEVSAAKAVSLEIKQRLQRVEETRRIPVIVISAHPELEYELLKVFDCIPVPVDLERLRGDVAILERSGGKRSLLAVEPLREEEYRLFHDFLVAFSGLHFDRRNMKILERGLQNRMAALHIGSYREYHTFLTRHRESRQELQKLLQFLTVGETYFFRYHAQFAALREFLATEVAADRKRRLRFWSAGCSTGEEPYSLAMTVMETLPDWRERDIRILATDINNRALKRAREGVYGQWAMRATDERYLDRYFDRVGRSFILKEPVKSLVEFSHLNLQTDEFPSPSGGGGELDAIFCRNVMIYFTLATMKKVVERFAACLTPGGYLFLGHAETLSQISTHFERHSLEGAFYYRKKSSAAAVVRRETKPVETRRAVRPLPPPPPARPAPVKRVAPPVEPNPAELYRKALELFDAENFQQASLLLGDLLERRPDHVGALVTEGFIQANNGHFQEALEICQKALQVDDLSPEAYFLKGLILDMSEQLAEARDEYRKAILLKADFVMPHYNLGRLLFRLEKEREGMRELRNSLKILEKSAEERIVPYSGGLTREVFLEQLRSELARVA